MTQVQRPRIEATEYSQAFWDAAARGELVVQRCSDCGSLRHYPQPLCPACTSAEYDWAPLSGRGVIYSYTVSHRAFHPAWKEHAPYVLATIELQEGIRMITDLLGVDPASVAIGQAVEVEFVDMPGQGVVPRFRRVEPDAAGGA